MTDQKPNRLFGSSPLTTVAIVIYFGVGYGLIKKFWPNSDVGLWILITVRIAPRLHHRKTPLRQYENAASRMSLQATMSWDWCRR